MDRLGEPNADRSMLLVAVVIVFLDENGLWIEALRQQLRPTKTVALHRRSEFRKIRMILFDEETAITIECVQVPGVRPNNVPLSVEDRAISPRDDRFQLLGAEWQARINQAQSRPNVVAERVLKERFAHRPTLTKRLEGSSEYRREPPDRNRSACSAAIHYEPGRCRPWTDLDVARGQYPPIEDRGAVERPGGPRTLTTSDCG